jgi:hypothetical protein
VGAGRASRDVVKNFFNLWHEDGEGGRILQKSGDTTKFSHKKIRIFSVQEFWNKDIAL